MQPIILVAEIMWDKYEDGSLLLGGSGLNIAWHLQGLECKSHVVSSVGNDSMGDKFKSVAKLWGISLEHIQTNSAYPTGIVKVVLDKNKKPTFFNQEQMATDHIQFNEKLKKFPTDSMVYHGTFMLRSSVTRQTIQKLRDCGHPVFMDLNLRDPYWSPELLDLWVRDLEFLKLSDDELVHLSGQSPFSLESHLDWLKKFTQEKKIENILLTLGAKGSCWIRNGEIFRTEAAMVDAVDTVGAGDAFCAAVLFSMHLDFQPQQTLEKASQFASRICTIHGATSHDKNFYQKCRKEIWG
jgi:fructokinase